ncbi:glycerol ether metabolic process [Coemansia erecta]|nr:glycerol ether metabolic process [Coemansia erecta]
MGGVTPHNMLKRRDELVRALLKAKCIRFDPKLSTGAPGNVELGSAQLMQLYQIQWPRFIAEKYRQSMSVPSILCRETQSMANAWDRAWAVTNICAEQLKTSAVTHRVLFNSRFGNAAQRRVAIHEGFVYAPGMAMNAILGSQEDLLHIVGPDTKAKICNQYFANIDTFRSAVVAAWQLYDWLIHSNPHKNAPPVLQRHFTLYEFRLANQRSENSSSSLIYRGLCAFDNLREATDALQRLDKTDTAGSDGESVRALDRKLVERYIKMQKITSVSNKKQFEEMLSAHDKAVVDFSASWCGSCKAMKPVFDKLASKHDDVTFLTVDVDENTDLAQEYGIKSMPTFSFIENGKVVNEVIGANKGNLEKSMDSFTA